MKSERHFINIGFVLLCLIWGSTWLAIKIGLDSVPPFWGVAIRFLVALPILFVLMKVRGLTIPRDKKSWNLFLAIGLLSFGFPFSILYWSEQYLPSGLMSILFAIFPFVVAMLSHFFLPDEKINVNKLSGIVLGFAGIVLIFSRGLQWNGQMVSWAMGGVLASTIFQGSGLVIVKKNGKDINPITLNFAGMLIGTLWVGLLAVLFENISSIRLDGKAIGSILYLGTLGSVVTFAVYFWLLKRVEAVYLSLVAFITPITAVFLGAIVLNETLDPNTFLGAALVLAGILVANGKGLKNLLFNSRNKETIVD